jgi:hypothetical protein
LQAIHAIGALGRRDLVGLVFLEPYGPAAVFAPMFVAPVPGIDKGIQIRKVLWSTGRGIETGDDSHHNFLGRHTPAEIVRWIQIALF